MYLKMVWSPQNCFFFFLNTWILHLCWNCSNQDRCFYKTSVLVRMNHHFHCFAPCPSLPCATGSWARSTGRICYQMLHGMPVGPRLQSKCLPQAREPLSAHPVISWGQDTLAHMGQSASQRKGTREATGHSFKYRRMASMSCFVLQQITSVNPRIILFRNPGLLGLG